MGYRALKKEIGAVAIKREDGLWYIATKQGRYDKIRTQGHKNPRDAWSEFKFMCGCEI